MNESEFLRTLVDRLTSYTPSGVQKWVESQRELRGRRKQGRLNAAAVRGGHRLVPEKHLEAKFCEVLRMLVERGGGTTALGDYLEFGVYNGSSLVCMHRALRTTGAEHVRLFGFDSFAGLPPEAARDDGGAWYPGQFSMDYRFARQFLTEHGIDWSRTFLIKGWFKDTLTPTLVQEHQIRKVSVVMVDCDMYSSSAQALSFCAPLLADSSVILFDDWYSLGLAERNLGERRAFDEFLAEHPHFRVEEFGQYSENSQVFHLSRDHR